MQKLLISFAFLNYNDLYMDAKVYSKLARKKVCCCWKGFARKYRYSQTFGANRKCFITTKIQMNVRYEFDLYSSK